MSRKRPPTPASEARNALAESIRARGQSPYNIWLIRPPFDKDDILLNSDVAVDLFYWGEGNHRFVQLDYSRLRENTSPTLIGREFARAEERDGTTVRIEFSVDKEAGRHRPPGSEQALVEVVTVATLDAAAQRTENWRRILGHIRRVTGHSTVLLERLLLIAVRDGEQKTVRQLLASHSDQHQALVLGALSILLRRRDLWADTDEKPWSLHTRVQRVAS